MTKRPRLRFGRTSSSTTVALASISRAAARHLKSGRRFAARKYLRAVYQLYVAWGRHPGVMKKIRKEPGTRRLLTPGADPIAVILEFTAVGTDMKQRSRWTRALQAAETENVPPHRLRRFFEANGGISGCAALAARRQPKRAPTPKASDPWYHHSLPSTEKANTTPDLKLP
jgi:hypothetical protein